MDEGKLYIGTKIIAAIPMDECSFLKLVKGHDVEGRETQPGYKVTYPDDYVSWTPKEVFEIAYREISEGEIALMI